jgi:hypothetical protein
VTLKNAAVAIPVIWDGRIVTPPKTGL